MPSDGVRRVEISRWGPPEVLKLRTGPGRDPGPGEVRIAVGACGVNYADVMGRLGLYAPAPPAPYVPGFEVAGTVLAVGPGVATPRPGERVIAATRFGGYASEVVAPARRVVALPPGWSLEEGAGLLVTYATAYHALVTLAHLGPGKWLLVHAGAGGVGTAAIQIARHLGARVVATAGGDAKARFCIAQGAESGVDYLAADWPGRARAATAGHGFDVVLDSVLGPTFRPSLELLAPMGHLVLCGAASFTPARRRNWLVLAGHWLRLPRIHPLDLIPTNRTLSGFNLLLLWDEEDYQVQLGEALAGLVRAGAVRPVLDRTFPLERAAEAHAHVQSRLSRGKVVLTVS